MLDFSKDTDNFFYGNYTVKCSAISTIKPSGSVSLVAGGISIEYASNQVIYIRRRRIGAINHFTSQWTTKKN